VGAERSAGDVAVGLLALAAMYIPPYLLLKNGGWLLYAYWVCIALCYMLYSLRRMKPGG